MKKISIIIPTYNRNELLKNCLLSAISQNYPKKNFEIVVVDNNSIDDTKDTVYRIIKKYPEVKIKYIIEKRQGLMFARHTGARNSKYGYLSFTDDDATLSKNWLSNLSFVYDLNPDIVAVSGAVNVVWDKKSPRWIAQYEHLLGKLYYGNDIEIRRDIFINGANFNIKKEILIKLRGFNPDQIYSELVGNGESGLCIKLHRNNYLIGWSPDAFVDHHQFVSLNGTVEDIKRRYMNSANVEVYRMYFDPDFLHIKFITILLLISIQFIFWSFIKGLTVKGSIKKNLYLFKEAYCLAFINYSTKIMFNSGFRRLLLKRDFI